MKPSRSSSGTCRGIYTNCGTGCRRGRTSLLRSSRLKFRRQRAAFANSVSPPCLIALRRPSSNLSSSRYSIRYSIRTRMDTGRDDRRNRRLPSPEIGAGNMTGWVEFDIKAAFDQIDHGLLMKAVRSHIKEDWILLYIRSEEHTSELQ